MLRRCQRCQNTLFLQTGCPKPVKLGVKSLLEFNFCHFSAKKHLSPCRRQREKGREGLGTAGAGRCACRARTALRKGNGENGRAGARARAVLKRPAVQTSQNSGAAATGPAIPSVSSSALSGQKVWERNIPRRAAARIGVSSSRGHRPPHTLSLAHPCTPTDSHRHVCHCARDGEPPTAPQGSWALILRQKEKEKETGNFPSLNLSGGCSPTEVPLPEQGWGRGQRRIPVPTAQPRGDEAFRASQGGLSLSLDGGFQPNWAACPPRNLGGPRKPQSLPLPPLSINRPRDTASSKRRAPAPASLPTAPHNSSAISSETVLRLFLIRGAFNRSMPI